MKRTLPTMMLTLSLALGVGCSGKDSGGLDSAAYATEVAAEVTSPDTPRTDTAPDLPGDTASPDTPLLDTPAPDNAPDALPDTGVDASPDTALDETGTDTCQPDCEGKDCGDDGCAGSCGDCMEHYACEDGTCVYQPWCGDLTCDAGQQENCLTCPADCFCEGASVCFGSACCLPQCEGKQCGYDGCGGNCGECEAGAECTQEGICKSPPPTCGDVNVPEGACTDPVDPCVCVGCVDDGACKMDDDCICPDCKSDAWCGDLANCVDDGLCSPFNESCGCADCVALPACSG